MSNNSNQLVRNLFLYDEVKESTVRTLVEKIDEINRFDDKKVKETYGNYDRSKFPIVLTLNTPGGSVKDGLALIDIMKTSKTPIHTVGLGMVASMGIPIFINGSKKVAHEHTVFMFHDVSYGAFGTFVQHERRMDMIDKFYRQKITKMILSKTDIRQADLTDSNEHIKDWYFDVEEAIKLGVCDSQVTLHRLPASDVKEGNFVVEE
jgi:ATP-dependent Clp protease, protease subunit